MSTHIDSPYTPLSWYTGQFRVLLLEPGQYDAEIRIQLIPARHGRLSWYEALSYVWGTELAPTPVVVNGKSRMAITENLDCALRHLRQPDEIRRLWVDAVCINQQDIDERNDQVKRMAQIYSQSHRTIIWLGPNQEYNYENLLSFVERKVQPGPKDCYTQSQIIEELNKIVRRPWFSRLWVLQEIIMSKLDPMVYIGHFRIPWSVFESGAGFFFDSYIESEDGDSALGWECLAEGEKVKSLARLRADGRHASLEFRLYDSRFQTATDPRDQIYGILGISDVRKGLLEPDYRLPVHTVFTKTVVVLIEHYSPMFYTIYPLRCEMKGVSGLPSWVPDLSMPAKWEAFKLHQHRQPSPAGILRGRNIFSTMSPFFAREKFPCIAKFSEDYKTMLAIGRPLGIITWASVPDEYFDTGAELRLYDLYHTSAKNWGYTPEIFHKALYDVRHLYTVPSHFRYFEEFLERDSAMQGFHPEFKDLLQDTLRSASYRTIFATDTGRFGQSYHPEKGGIRAGDVLVGLFGIDFPFILRPMGAERYEIVNVAHVVDYEWRNLPPMIEISEKGSWRDLESFGLRVYEIV